MKTIVVGAGIAGLSTAWSLTKRGHDVTILEQGPIPNPLAASGDHHRIIRRAYGAATGYGKLITEAYDAWEELWRDLGQSHYDAKGFLCVSRESGDVADEYREGMEEGGWPIELMQPDRAVERWPFLEAGTFRYAFFSPEGGALHCRRIAAAIADWLRANGADVREHGRVTAIDSEAGKVTLADGEAIEGDRVVVTAGAWVTKLFPDLVGDLTTHRTAVVYLEPPQDLRSAWEAAPVILNVGGKTDGYIVPQSGDGGLKFGSGLHKRAQPDADADRVAREGEGESIRDRFSPPIARISDYEVRDVVTCAYTFTQDKRFFTTAKGRCTIVSACSGHGYKFGAAVGRRAADAVESGDAESFGRWMRAQVV